MSPLIRMRSVIGPHDAVPALGVIAAGLAATMQQKVNVHQEQGELQRATSWGTHADSGSAELKGG